MFHNICKNILFVFSLHIQKIYPNAFSYKNLSLFEILKCKKSYVFYSKKIQSVIKQMSYL